MCGIAGIARVNDSSVPAVATLRAMVSSIRHRGPDGQGYHTSPGIGLGHARLSIIDLASGQQPIHNEDRTVWVSYNGEIFNYLELRSILEKRGHAFYTHTDTEVIVHAYEEFGDGFVEQLNGQFAIALWDDHRRRLVLIRDRVGILPLYYSANAETLTFGSEVKALLASGEIDAEIDPVGLDQILTYWSPLAPRTIFKGVSQVRPGEMVSLERGRISRRLYWRWECPPEKDLVRSDDGEVSREVLTLLDAATQIRLRADVPVGAYLSGGLDSSSLVALLQRGGVEQLKTFSVGFESRALDESEHQRELSDWLHTEHSAVLCTDADIEQGFLDTIFHTEVPVLRTSPTPMRMLSALVRRNGIKVVLTGEGADEVLGGYDLFKEAKIRYFWSRNANSAWRPLLLKRLYPYLDLGDRQGLEYLKAFFGKGLDQPDSASFSHLPRWEVTAQIKRFYSERMRQARLPDYLAEISADVPEAFDSWHPFNRAEYLEAKTLLPGYLLSSQGDRMLMANSVEGRFPFLDHTLIEFANRLHPKHKMRALNEKAALKRAMQGLLPPRILARYKQPYRGPGAGSLLGERGRQIAGTLLSSERLDAAGCFDPKSVARLKQKVERGARLGERDNMAFIGILATQAWHYWFVEGEWRQTTDTSRIVEARNAEG